MTGLGPAAVSAFVACLGIAACGGGDDGGEEEGRSASIEGSVNVQGAPVAGAPVAVDLVVEGADPNAPAGEPTAESETDDDGTYRFADLEPGTYTVFADASGCRILATVEVEADATETADLEIPPNYTPVGPLSLLPDGNILSC
jgi:hypothetical protein